MTPAPATVMLPLDQGEIAALRQLIDAALRHSGIGAVQAAMHFLVKLEAAAAPSGQEAGR